MLRRIRVPEFRRRKIYSPEEIERLRESKKVQIAELAKDVSLGAKGSVAKEVVGAFLDTVEDDVLEALLNSDADPQAVKLYYQAATKFADMLNGFISTGEKRKTKISRLLEELKNNNRRSD